MIRLLLLLVLLAGPAKAGDFVLPQGTEALVLQMRSLGKTPGFGSRRLPQQAPPAAVQPINAGFLALGPTGTEGKVDGPGSQGNGTYTMVKNDPFEVIITIKTGFLAATLTFTRDQATGQDTLRFVGKNWNTMKGRWGPDRDDTMPLVVAYDADSDSGTFRWVEKGKKMKEGFWDGGSAGAKKMTIELGGGWDHTFSR